MRAVYGDFSTALVTGWEKHEVFLGSIFVYLSFFTCLEEIVRTLHPKCLEQHQQLLEKFTYLRHVCLVENVTALQLQIVRDKGLLGDIAIQLVAKPNFLLHINNQATENEDYVLQETMIIMKENIKETYVKVAILPVSLGFNEYDMIIKENEDKR